MIEKNNIFLFFLIIFLLVFLGIPVSALETPWTKVTDHAPFPPRQYFSMVDFNDKMWIIGGAGPSNYCMNDVWSSTDGITWDLTTPSAVFTPRYGHTTVVFDDKMWVIGGYDSSHHPMNDVWYTTDGLTWVQQTAHASFPPRHMHSSVVYDGKMWVIGGVIGDSPGVYANDVWYSSDGAAWNQATAAAPFPGRIAQASVVFDNKIRVIGGLGENTGNVVFNDSWYSTDGKKWQKAGFGGFTPRYWFACVPTPGGLLVMGGVDGKNPLKDFWSSSDGTSWTQVSSPETFSPRYGHNAVVFGNHVWMTGGADPSNHYFNDVWRSRELVLPTAETIHINKTVSPHSIKQGTDAKITITFSNLGSTSVHDIQIMDNIPAEFPIVSGKRQVQISETLMPNETRLLVYTVHAAKTGRFTLPAASVLYAGEDGNYHQAASNTVPVEVLAPLFPSEGSGIDQPGDPFSGIMNGVSSFFFSIIPNSQGKTK
jgi:hypothetical protein